MAVDFWAEFNRKIITTCVDICDLQNFDECGYGNGATVQSVFFKKKHQQIDDAGFWLQNNLFSGVITL